jgi:hypothetical protein
MAMICPKCANAFEQQLTCPACGVRLVSEVPARAGLLDSSQWQQTPWGRIFVGLLLAQGLAHALRLLCTSFLLATADEAARNAFWGTLGGLLLLQGFQAMSLIIGGAVTGAGQHRGFFYGSVLGVGNGLCFMALQLATGHQSLTEAALFGQPILHLAFGAIGGMIGSMIWRPLPTLLTPRPSKDAKPDLVLANLKKSILFSGRVAWMRVLAGIGVAVGGAVWTKFIFDLVLAAGHGTLSVTSTLQAQLVTWEIYALTMLLGGGLAGAAAFNGPKQGLCVGIGTSVVLAGFSLGGPAFVPSEILFNSATTILLALAGGWFGAQLLPPVLTHAQLKRIRSCGSI